MVGFTAFEMAFDEVSLMAENERAAYCCPSITARSGSGNTPERATDVPVKYRVTIYPAVPAVTITVPFETLEM